MRNEFREGVPEHILFAGFGSGPSLYDIDFECLPVNGYSFARAPQSFRYDFRLMKQYADHIDDGAVVVVVVVCPLGFGYNRAYQQKDYNRRYYGWLPLSEIDVVGKRDYLICKYLPFMVHPKGFAKKILRKLGLRRRRKEPGTVNWTERGRLTYEDWISGAQLNNLADAAQADAPEQLQASQEKIEIMQSMLKFCKERHWKPVIVIPPFTEEAVETISPEFKERFVDRNLKEANIINAPVLDYWGNKEWTHEYFSNVCFMNKKGARKFTQQLWKDICEVYGGKELC